MKVTDFPHYQLQRMRLAVKHLPTLAEYFEGDRKWVIAYLKKHTKPPVKYVKDMQRHDLAGIILEYGYRKAAKWLGVSESFLRKQGRAAANVQWLPMPDKDVEDLAKRLPIPRLLAAIANRPDSQVRKFCPDMDLNGDFTSARGRRAELFYLEIRGIHLKEQGCPVPLTDMNDGKIHPDYDVHDPEWNKIQVRSSKARLNAGQDRVWYFNTSGKDVCDRFALIGYDLGGNTPLFIVMVNAKQLSPDYNNLTINEKRLETYTEWIRAKDIIFLDNRYVRKEA